MCNLPPLPMVNKVFVYQPHGLSRKWARHHRASQATEGAASCDRPQSTSWIRQRHRFQTCGSGEVLAQLRLKVVTTHHRVLRVAYCGRHQQSFTANHGLPELRLGGSNVSTSSCSQDHGQPQVPPAGLGSGIAPGLDPKVVGHRLHGYPVTSAAEASRPGAGVHIVQPPGAPHGPLPLVCSKASPPTRRDTRFAPRILRQAGAPRAPAILVPTPRVLVPTGTHGNHRQ
jgi:hypothetical protein